MSFSVSINKKINPPPPQEEKKSLALFIDDEKGGKYVIAAPDKKPVTKPQGFIMTSGRDAGVDYM